MSERFSLIPMGPLITETMRAARQDELAQRIDESVGKMQCVFPGCPYAPGPHCSNTRYSDPASNWHLLCDMHAAEDDAERDARWREYYSGLF